MLQDMIVSDFMPGVLEPTEGDIKAINGLSSGPLRPLSSEDVYVREMRLVGDQLTSYYSRFRERDLSKVAASTQGRTMLFGHDKTHPGQGRFFIAEPRVLDGGGGKMVYARFYWPRGRSDAEDLRVNIDTGVYHECSVSFQFRRPTCSVCGNDIRDYAKCQHFPGRTYDIVSRDGKKEKRLCFYWIDEFVTVLEGSIVYMGAHPATGFGSLEMRMASEGCGWLRELWEKKGQKRRIVVRGGIEVERGVL